ncbi:MAG: uncharacterized protein JWN04_3698, partial [Myxococcaceae bacterium]|nr:uncharacterized protein [Myxococcaceae bacterium]
CGGGAEPWGDPRAFGWHAHHYHRRGRGSRFGMLRSLFGQLDTTPGQEKAIVAALAAARERFKSFKLELTDARRDIAALVSSDVLDEAALEALWSERRDTLDHMSKELVRTLATVHEVLDTRQRRELGELLADGSIGQALRPRYEF